MRIKTIGIGDETIRILHRFEIGITVVDPRPANHPLEQQLVAPVIDHAAYKAHKGVMHIIGRHRGADAIDMCRYHAILPIHTRHPLA